MKKLLPLVPLLSVTSINLIAGEVIPFPGNVSYSGNTFGLRDDGLNRYGNCTPPAIEQFPRTMMTAEQRSHGGLVFHVLVASYMFAALSIVCDDYFVPSLESISTALHLSADVAGATFMAAGSSGPELATTVIGVFVSKDDIGTSGVIGSAVFNIMLVIGACAFFAACGKGPTVVLSWWPMFRDSLFYMLSICAMLLVIYDGVVYWYEAMAMLILYAMYCVIMYLNSTLEMVVTTWATLPCNKPAYNEKSALVTSASFDGYNGPEASVSLDGINPVPIGPDVDFSVLSDKHGEEFHRTLEKIPPEIPPEKRSGFSKFLSALIAPVTLACWMTIPDCTQERWKKWYVVSFFMSMVWIAIFSYVMVWMLTVIGFTVGIGDTVMGFTILAAGVSMPDMFASVAVVKQGYGDMAVSNAIGSNVFDILLCLGLPWFLQTVVVDPGSTVLVTNEGLTYMTLSLFSTVIFLLVATHLSKWRLTIGYGVVLVIWYCVFMVFGLLYELNVFGMVSLPQCTSNY